MKTAIITGASSGLGKEFAYALKKEHPELESFWLIARRADRLTELAREIGEERCLCLSMDLTEKSSMAELRQLLGDTQPEVTFLINNAGFGKLGNFADVPAEDSIGQIELNCVALTAVTAAVLPFMEKGGSLINIASIAAFAPNTRLTVYSSTKAYVYSFSKGLRQELKSRDIHVLAVCPGPMDTEFLPVAGIGKGDSKTFDTLPRVKPKTVARRALKAAQKNKAVYTCKLFYRFYHLLAKLLPHSLVMKFCKA